MNDDLPALPEPIRKHDGQPLFGSGQMCEYARAAVAQRDEQIEQFRETTRKITRVLVSAGFASDRSFVWDDVQRMADTITALRAEVEALRAKITNALDALNDDDEAGAHLILYDAARAEAKDDHA